MSKLQNIRYKQVRPQATSTYDSFNGEVTFLFNVANNEVYVPSESYLNVVIQLQQSGVANAVEALDAETGLSASPLSCLFTNGTLNINNKEVCKLSEFPQSGHIYNVLSNSRQSSLTDSTTNPIYMAKRYGFAATSTVDGELESTIGTRKLALGIRNAATPANSVHVIELAQKLPLLITNDEVDGNTNYQYKLQVENSWRNQILERNGAFNGSITNLATPSTVAGTIKMDVIDIYFNVSVYETDSIPRSVASTVSYKEMFSTTRTIADNSSSEQFTITMPRNTESVFFCLFDSRRLSNAQISPTALYCGALKVLKSYEIRYGKSIMPSPLYNMNLLDEADSIISRNRGGNSRAFKEFIYNTMGLTPESSSLDLVTWASNPIFYHRIIKPVGDMSNDLDLSLTFNGGAHANSILYVGGIYGKEATIEYNDTGLVSQVVVKEVV